MIFLPSEIIDYIIDNLSGDRRMLGKCSLVCKEWLPASYSRLFSDVELRVQNADRDLNILSAPVATIPAYIRNLRIDACEDWDLGNGFQKLVRSLPLMSKLKLLGLKDVCFVLGDASAKGNLFSLSRSISTLELTNVFFKESGDQTEMISASPKLETLFLSSITYRKISPPNNRHIVPSLKQLQLVDTYSWHAKGPTTSSILKWFALDSQPVPALKTLELHGISRHKISAICSYVHSFASTLESILIECNSNAARDALGKELNLSDFRALKKIVLHAPTYQFDLFGSKASAWIPLILSKVSSERIQLVSFCLDCYDPVDFSRFDLSSVGKLFTGEISCLSASTIKIHFEIDSRFVGVDELRKPITANFPSLAGRLEFGNTVKSQPK